MRPATAFLGLLCSGIFALLAGLTLTRVHWRPDIPPYGRRTRFLHVARCPREYVKDAPIRTIASLNLTGALLIAAAAAVVAYEIFLATL